MALYMFKHYIKFNNSNDCFNLHIPKKEKKRKETAKNVDRNKKQVSTNKERKPKPDLLYGHIRIEANARAVVCSNNEILDNSLKAYAHNTVARCDIMIM